MAARAPGGGLIGYFVRHPTVANLLLLLMLGAGIWAAPQMRAQFFPDSVVEEVTVSVAWDGAGPEDIDRAVVQLLDPALRAVEGVARTSALSREGRAVLTVEFEPGWNMTRGAADIQTAVDQIRNLPAEAETPQVSRGGWRDRVTDVVITGPVGVDQLARFADEFVARLFAAGVTRATIQGLAAPETVIEVPSIRLIEHDVTLSEIAAAIRGATEARPAGDIEGSSARLRAGDARRSPEALARVVVQTKPDGSSLTVGDLATIRVEPADRSRAYYVGGNPAIAIRVDRSDRGDAIEMQARVERAAAAMAPDLPPGVTIDLIRTRAEAISGRLSLLIDNGLLGLGLVVVFLFLFLNARTAFWVAAGIPVAMAGALALMFALGVTLNMISLFALILTLGIVVDDAIVVGEHADHRARELGEAPEAAAANAAGRMAAPVFAATATTVIAFLGLMIVGGSFGTLIADIPVTVALVLIASLVECFLILPRHMAHALAHSARDRWYDLPSRLVNRGFVRLRDRMFRPFVAGVITARYPVLAGAVALLAWQGGLFLRGDVPWRFFNAPEQGSVTGNFAMLPTAKRADTLQMLAELQRALDEVAAAYEAEHGVNPVTYALAEIGGNAGRALSGADTKDPSQLGAISIELVPPDMRPYSSFDFVARLQEAVRGHPLLEELSFRGWRSGPGGDALSVDLHGAEAPVLKAAAEALKTALAAYPEVSALEDTLAWDKEELILTLTPRGEALGFTIESVGQALRERLSGIEAATYPVGPRSARIRVELPAGEFTADFLDRALMRAPSGAWVPLADIARVERQAGFSTVRRENGLRLVTVRGDISEDDPARAAAITTELREFLLPRIEADFGVSVRQSGLAAEERAFLSDALVGFLLCLMGIYLVLAWVFGSWSRPAVVMAVIPFGLVGAIWGHAVWEVPLSMFSVVGLIGLAGIIINDSIVLVGTADEYRRTRGLHPAIVAAAADRLRPVLLTTLTTVVGLAPLLFERSQDALFLKPTVITLVYGLGFGMVLVLLVVPALLAAQADVGRAAAALRRAIRKRRRAGPAGLAVALAAAGMSAWFAATMGWVAVTGALPPPVAAIAPAAGGMAGAFGLFLAGAAALAALAWAIGGFALLLGRGRARG